MEEKEITVLVVDDDKDYRAIIGAALERSGYGVLIAGNISDAYQIARAERPDAAVIDNKVEIKGDGLDLACRLDKDGLVSKCNIIGMSGTPDVGGEWTKRGFRLFMYKPFRIDYLRKLVEEALNIRK